MKNQRGYVLLIVILIAAAIGGYLVYSGKMNLNQYKATPSPTTDASPAPTGTEETANWKTYINKDYKYTIKYPANWQIGSSNGSQESIRVLVTFKQEGANEQDQLSTNVLSRIFIEDTDTTTDTYKKRTRKLQISGIRLDIRETTLEEAIQTYYSSFPKEQVDIDGVKATKIVLPENMNVAFIEKGQLLYMIAGVYKLADDPAISDNNEDIFNQIISTFRFQ